MDSYDSDNIILFPSIAARLRQLSAIYGSTLWLDEPLLATSLSVQLVGPRVAIDLYGIGLHDRAGLPVRSLMPSDRAKYRPAYQDDEVSIFENSAALPRAFLVGSARVAAPGRTVVEPKIWGSAVSSVCPEPAAVPMTDR